MSLILRVLAAIALAVCVASAPVAAEPIATKPADAAGKPAGKTKTTQPVIQPKPNEPVEGTTNGEKWWHGQYERINTDIKKMDGKIDLGFVGDSITARWGGESWKKHWGAYRAVNMGIGGDRTQNVLWRLDHGQLDGYKARVFVVMIGTNNLWDKKADPAEVAEGIKAILDRIKTKQPQAKILLLSIFPRGDKPNPGRDKITAVNGLISKFEGGQVSYMDISAKFLEPNGTISEEVMKDHLHLASKGFDIWADAIKDKVKELLNDAGDGQKRSTSVK